MPFVPPRPDEIDDGGAQFTPPPVSTLEPEHSDFEKLITGEPINGPKEDSRPWQQRLASMAKLTYANALGAPMDLVQGALHYPARAVGLEKSFEHNYPEEIGRGVDNLTNGFTASGETIPENATRWGASNLLLGAGDSIKRLGVRALLPELAGAATYGEVKDSNPKSLPAQIALPILASTGAGGVVEGLNRAINPSMVEGAKEAWATAQRTTPYLVAMLVAITMLQKSGVIDLVTQALQPVLSAVHFPAELLPMVLMRPLSGSATNGIFVELVQRLHEPDGYISRLAGTIYGSTETTFYVLAIYFGSVSIRQSRHAIAAGLTADTVAVIASVILCSLMFG